MRVRAFISPKGAETENDCQDRFSINPETGSVAVSDGMSQSLFPKYWAEILSRKYTSGTDWTPSHESVRPLGDLWREKVEGRLERMREDGRSTWRTENMLSDGLSAGATLVGVRTDREGWRCDVLGDSCLVVLREGRIVGIHSSMDTDSFGNYPDYFDSDPGKTGRGEVRTIRGSWEDSQVMLLVTDPLAGFLSSVRGSDREKVVLGELLSVESSDEFGILVDYLREDGMHDDDTTMVVLTCDCEEVEEPFNRQEDWIWQPR